MPKTKATDDKLNGKEYNITWRVVFRAANRDTEFVYDEERLSELRKEGEILRISGPFKQILWVKEHNLTPDDLEIFRAWAKSEMGISPEIYARSTKESKLNLLKMWYEENRK